MVREGVLCWNSQLRPIIRICEGTTRCIDTLLFLNKLSLKSEVNKTQNMKMYS